MTNGAKLALSYIDETVLTTSQTQGDYYHSKKKGK